LCANPGFWAGFVPVYFGGVKLFGVFFFPWGIFFPFSLGVQFFPTPQHFVFVKNKGEGTLFYVGFFPLLYHFFGVSF